jgi:tRNA pseudouridine38-40 synthase
MQAEQTPATRRVALLLEYDGTRFAGSQLQANARTVQGELEAAILKTTGESVRCAFAGRTDARVHATGQVGAFNSKSRLDPETLRNALNHWLPDDVAVRAAADAPPAFDPRRQALRRTYRYVVDNGAGRPVLDRAFVWHVRPSLDAALMHSAAQALVGEHDFAAFASALEDSAALTVRRLECFAVRRDGRRLTFEVTANAFLPHQVRRMVGALVEVGRAKITPSDYRRLLDGLPSSAGPAAPARGLTLIAVDYERPLFRQH